MFWFHFPFKYSSIALAAFLPAPIALITVAAPVTTSPPAKTPHLEVAPVFFICNYGTLFVLFKTFRAFEDNRVRGCTYGDYYNIGRNCEFKALDRDRASPA